MMLLQVLSLILWILKGERDTMYSPSKCIHINRFTKEVFLFIAICKASSANHFAFLHLFFLGMVLIPVSCTSWTSVHSSSGALSGLITWVCLSLPLYNHKGFDLGLSEWSSGFPYFLKFNCQFANKEFMIQGTVSSQSCFGWLYRASPSLAAKNTSSLISVLTIWWYPCIESSLVLLEEGVYPFSRWENWV